MSGPTKSGRDGLVDRLRNAPFPNGWSRHPETLDVVEAMLDAANRIEADAAEITRLRAEVERKDEELQAAEAFIDGLRQDLFSRRVADWYPEGAHNAAEAMSEDMRLLGNACAEFDVRAALEQEGR